MKVFISGPISGTDDYKERFKAAEKMIKAAGDIAINPVKLTKQLPEGTPWETYMKMTLTALEASDAIYMLTDWDNSKGACIEHAWAVKTDKTIFYEH